MTIVPQADDAPEFVQIVSAIVEGVTRRHAPPWLVLVKIDNWFGPKWLGFKGKVLGALGTWSIPYSGIADHVTLPAFVPNRVVSQRGFAGPSYNEIETNAIHKHIPSDLAAMRRMSNELSGVAMIWYSGNSLKAERGAVMSYIPVGNSYWPGTWDGQKAMTGRSAIRERSSGSR